jgi:hypothetical protein
MKFSTTYRNLIDNPTAWKPPQKATAKATRSKSSSR